MERAAPWTAKSQMLQPHKEVSRKMRDTAGGTPALPFEEGTYSCSSTSMLNIPLFPNNL